MRRLVRLLPRFGRDQRGLSSIEYGFIAALIAMLLVVSVGAIGTNLSATFADLGSRMAAAGVGG